MQQNRFRVIDSIMGWLVFAIATTVYCLTAESTASLWDCSEFIISAYKLEIGHPPGAPFFMLTANLFTQFASDPSQVALMVNIMSALFSAGCVMFLYWTVSHLMRRLLCGYAVVERVQDIVLIEGAALVGALVCMFSDSFWYSAVEAEVYAYSSFLTALVFWMILKWEEEADGPGANRWLLLISYFIGLSIGVHLLNLLCIPAMVLVFYFRMTARATTWGICKALLISFALLGGVLYGLIPVVLWLAGLVELLAVNILSLPFNSGLVVFVFLLSLLIAWGMWLLQGTRRLVLCCVAMILVGFSCYAVILVRSAANPPMDENSPEDVFALKRYLNREQYEDHPLFYGPAYNAKPRYERKGNYMVAGRKEGETIWSKSEELGKYVDEGNKIEYVYENNMLFPRMHSARHAKAYEQWMGGVKGPTMKENIGFFVSYQLYFMYIRYFMWNFVGRQNDIPGNGEAEHGNWITGIDAIDGILLGCDMDKLPSDLRENKGRNVYYGLPLLMGLLGMFWQRRRAEQGRAQFLITFWLFFMTGIAIVLYLNQTPMQARERDYSYAGSFYAFSIWVGLGTGAVAALLRRLRIGERTSVIVAVLLCLLVPLQMGCQNWDDHDRSGRYACRDFGQNYLESASEEGYPIIFCHGDNDTFPLWYTQEVEGKRTDTRACNLSYATADWYVDQMCRPAYDSPALPLGWKKGDYSYGNNDVVRIEPELHERVLSLYRQEPHTLKRVLGEEPFDMANILRHWVFNRTDGMSEEDVRLRRYVKALACGREDEWETLDIRCIPTDTAFVMRETGKKMPLSFAGKEMLLKNDLLVLQLLVNADETRPLFVTTSMSLEEISYLKPHLVLEGLLYRVAPLDTTGGEVRVDLERLYTNIMERFSYGGLSAADVYADYDVRKMAYGHQHKMATLIDTLLRQGDEERALSVVRKWQQEMSAQVIPYDEAALAMLHCLYHTGNDAEADALAADMLSRSNEWLEWIGTLRPERRRGSAFTEYQWRRIMEKTLSILYNYDRKELLGAVFSEKDLK